jgi:hypothetical protein
MNSDKEETLSKFGDDIVAAYGDCNKYVNSNYSISEKNRKLEALGIPLSLDSWHKVMNSAVPDGYNEFQAERVYKALEPYKSKITVIPGREGSPVCYVNGDAETLNKIASDRESYVADEVHYYASGYDWKEHYRGPVKVKIPGPVLRLWWD